MGKPEPTRSDSVNKYPSVAGYVKASARYARLRRAFVELSRLPAARRRRTYRGASRWDQILASGRALLRRSRAATSTTEACVPTSLFLLARPISNHGLLIDLRRGEGDFLQVSLREHLSLIGKPW